jgi:hypothetical protein
MLRIGKIDRAPDAPRVGVIIRGGVHEIDAQGQGGGARDGVIGATIVLYPVDLHAITDQ